MRGWWLIVVVAACSKPRATLGQLPARAGELFGALCVGTNGGSVEPDDGLQRGKGIIWMGESPNIEMEGVRCGPEDPQHHSFNAMAWERETRRLVGLNVRVKNRDIGTLRDLVLPALGPVQLVGYQLELARANVPALAEKPHHWTDGQTVIWTGRAPSVDDPNTLEDSFQIGVFVLRSP